MRNLKKVLSLTLALVMMLGMMTFAGAAETKKVTAADFKDMDKVVNKEAVTLLVDLGIINGIKAADGTYTFNPAGNIERGAYAKMVYAVLMATDKADVYKGANTGLTDVKGHWAEGYIAYCVSTKIAAGNPNKTFTPNANISVVAGAKMLLTALGYDAKLSKYENDALWAINIMADAQAAALMDGIELGANAMLTRDVAAKMIYNALKATKVTPVIDRDQGVAYLTDYKHSVKTLGETVYGLYSVKTTATAIDKDGVMTLDITGLADANLAAVNAANTANLKGTVDMVGNTVVIYAKGAITDKADGSRTIAYKSLYSTSVSAAPATVIGTSMNGTAWAKLTDKTDKKFIAEVHASKTAYYLNGNLSDLTKATADVGKGVIVTFLDTKADTAYADVVKVTKKSVAEVTGTVLTKTDKDGNVTVKVPGIAATNAYASCEGYEGLVKGDVVLYVNANGVISIEKAASVEGKVTAKNNDNEIKVDGTYYGDSGLGTYNSATFEDFDNTFIFYLDNAKNIVKTKQVTEETSSEYIFVLESGWKAGTGEVGAKDGFANARIMHTDGTNTVVVISTYEGDKVNNTSPTAAGTNKLHSELVGHFYSYTVDKDGAYELKSVANAEKKIEIVNAVASEDITNGKPMFDKATGGHIGNSSTLFFVKGGTTKDPVYKVYTGIANVPAMTVSSTTSLDVNSEIITKNSIATHVFLNAKENSILGGAGEYVYVIGQGDAGTDLNYTIVPKNGNVAQHYVVSAVVNGVVTDLKVKDLSTVVASGLKVNIMYKVATKNTDGIVLTVTAVGTGDTAGDVNTGYTRSNDTLMLNKASSADRYTTVDKDSTIYLINKDGSTEIGYADITDDVNNKIMIAKKTDSHADVVYIVDIVSKVATASATNTDCIVTIGGSAGGTVSGLTSWKTGTGTFADPKVAQDTVSVKILNANKGEAFTFTLKADDDAATVTLVSGTVPGKGEATTPSSGDVTLVYQVVAEDGTSVMYYQVKLAITNAES